MKQNLIAKRAATALCGLLAAFALTRNALASTVELAADSVDGLASAIASAGAGGTVLVKRGMHSESGTVLVNIPVSIVGEKGAVIKSGTSPSLGAYPLTIQPVLHIQNASDVKVQRISFLPSAVTANCAVLIDNSPRTKILENEINGFQFGVFSQSGDHVLIIGNRINTSQQSDLPETDGIIVNNGPGVEVADNDVSGAGSADSSTIYSTGIFVGGRQGYAHNNSASGCKWGFFACHNKPGTYKDEAGSDLAGEVPSKGWLVQDNRATGNAWGYFIVDGANNNVWFNNAASRNRKLDIYLGGDVVPIYGPLPTSQNNLVVQDSHKRLTVKDCGLENVILGNVILSTDCP